MKKKTLLMRVHPEFKREIKLQAVKNNTTIIDLTRDIAMRKKKKNGDFSFDFF